MYHSQDSSADVLRKIKRRLECVRYDAGHSVTGPTLKACSRFNCTGEHVSETLRTSLGLSL